MTKIAKDGGLMVIWDCHEFQPSLEYNQFILSYPNFAPIPDSWQPVLLTLVQQGDKHKAHL